MTAVERPLFVKEKHLVFLDDLRETGITNMYGASPFLQQAFRMSSQKAVDTLKYWMKTFSERHPELARRRGEAR